MADVQKDYSQMQKRVDACNIAIRCMDKKAYAFLKWVPMIYDAYTPSAAFERDVLNYYQLLGECGGYIWHSDSLKEHLRKKGCVLSQHRLLMFDYLRQMRLFYAHRINADFMTPLDKVCQWLSLSGEYGRLSGIVESRSFNVLAFQQDDAFWESARQSLDDQIAKFLTEYETALKLFSASPKPIQFKFMVTIQSHKRNRPEKDQVKQKKQSARFSQQWK